MQRVASNYCLLLATKINCMLGLTILGNNSAIPAYDRHPTAQVLSGSQQLYLIDCGEGTQMQLSHYKIKRSRIHHIFISHLHGDHYFGLIGLLNSMSLMGREQPLNLYGPAALMPIINMQLAAADTRLSFPLKFHALEADGILMSNEELTVSCFEVKHRIPCWGFVFTQKKAPRKLDMAAVIAAGIPAIFFNRLKWGEDYETKSGDRISNDKVTLPASPPLRYAYCADTMFDPSICRHLKHCTLLYHEATFLNDLQERAANRFHSTAAQAAAIAQMAQPHRLLIGHFSSKYEDLSPFLAEAKAVFPHTELALEGVTFLLRNSDSANAAA